MSTTLTKPEPRAVRQKDPFQTVREEIESLWSHVVGDRNEGWFPSRLTPALDMVETPANVEVRMDLPGIKPEELDIQLANNVLTVSGKREELKEEKSETRHHVERRWGTFSRSMTLPASVAEDKVDARYRDGVLAITLPKTEDARGRRIKVKA
jgi:HSP20 family protein